MRTSMDTDADGMADALERDRQLDPNDPDDEAAKILQQLRGEEREGPCLLSIPDAN